MTRKRRKCDTKQTATLVLEKDSVLFWDEHATRKKDCVGNPCQQSVHAEQALVARCARKGIELGKQKIHLDHTPCLSCANLLSLLDLDRLTMTKAPKDEMEEIVWEMLAMRFPITVCDNPREFKTHSPLPRYSEEEKTPRIKSKGFSRGVRKRARSED